MPEVEYKKGKIDRRFTPEWKDSGNSDPANEILQNTAVMQARVESMVDYIEQLHDEIDRLQIEKKEILKEWTDSTTQLAQMAKDL